MAKQVKRMRIIIEVDCDNTAAMFDRVLFNKHVAEIGLHGASFADHFPQGIVFLATEDVDDAQIISHDGHHVTDATRYNR